LRAIVCLLLLGFVLSFGFDLAPSSRAQETPWKRRMRQGVVLDESSATRHRTGRSPLTAQEMRRLGLRPRGGGLVDLTQWPSEPPSPANVAPEALTGALAQLCPTAVERRVLELYSEAIVRYAAEFAVDPWLLAALVYTQSDCSHDIDNSYGTGLTLLNPGMHARHIEDGVYRFGVREPSGWAREALAVGAFRFDRASLRTPAANIYFAAAVLAVFREQCPHIDRPFDSVPHRHFVSHFVWGDQVGDTGPEDRILTARRRLLDSYTQTRHGRDRVGEIPFVSPLDGHPRIVTSGLGEPRDHGRRPHRGIDFASEYGEPVRAVAHGTVTFAGVDWERRAMIPLEPWGAALVHERHMGPRGLFVEVDHGNGLVSLYAHLSRYEVQVGDRVEAGERLGEVGRTGVRDSGPHLHFGLFEDGKVLDPLKHLAAYVFPPSVTKRGVAVVRKSASRRRTASPYPRRRPREARYSGH
jgi:murein DD-endopeptidase MepM/ murein hydrolase activator NlpD